MWIDETNVPATVIPANAGIQFFRLPAGFPAFAGMTKSFSPLRSA
jgi:hypothetical protein